MNTPHALDGAIEYTQACLDWPEALRDVEAVQWLQTIALCAAATKDSTGPAHYCICAANCHNWLLSLGVDDPWQAMRVEYDRARAKHGDCTLDGDGLDDIQRYCALLEEVGEVARTMTYDQDHAGELAGEVTQCGALALAWLVRILREPVWVF